MCSCCPSSSLLPRADATIAAPAAAAATTIVSDRLRNITEKARAARAAKVRAEAADTYERCVLPRCEATALKGDDQRMFDVNEIGDTSHAECIMEYAERDGFSAYWSNRNGVSMLVIAWRAKQ